MMSETRFYGQNSLKKDSLPGRELIFETWCYTRSKKNGKYIEKEWKICDHDTEKQARDHADILQKRDGWGLSGPNMVGRRYSIKVITK